MLPKISDFHLEVRLPLQSPHAALGGSNPVSSLLSLHLHLLLGMEIRDGCNFSKDFGVELCVHHVVPDRLKGGSRGSQHRIATGHDSFMAEGHNVRGIGVVAITARVYWVGGSALGDSLRGEVGDSIQSGRNVSRGDGFEARVGSRGEVRHLVVHAARHSVDRIIVLVHHVTRLQSFETIEESLSVHFLLHGGRGQRSGRCRCLDNGVGCSRQQIVYLWSRQGENGHVRSGENGLFLFLLYVQVEEHVAIIPAHSRMDLLVSVGLFVQAVLLQCHHSVS